MWVAVVGYAVVAAVFDRAAVVVGTFVGVSVVVEAAKGAEAPVGAESLGAVLFVADAGVVEAAEKAEPAEDAKAVEDEEVVAIIWETEMADLSSFVEAVDLHQVAQVVKLNWIELVAGTSEVAQPDLYAGAVMLDGVLWEPETAVGEEMFVVDAYHFAAELFQEAAPVTSFDYLELVADVSCPTVEILG